MIKINLEKYYDIVSNLDFEEIKKNKKKLINLIKNKNFKEKLSRNPKHCFYYCKYIYEKRCIDLEEYFLRDSTEALNYSVYVLNEELPETLHNFMIAKSLEDDNSAKQYFVYWGSLKNKNLGVWGNYK